MITPASALEPPLRPSAALDKTPHPGLLGRMSAEALGTFLVVVAGLGVPLFTIPQSNPLSAPLAAGLALTAAMLAFGYLSGGHFNPVVTAGNALAGRLRVADAAAYVGAQLVGALVGAGALFGVLRTVPNIADTRTAFDDAGTETAALPAPAPAPAPAESRTGADDARDFFDKRGE